MHGPYNLIDEQINNNVLHCSGAYILTNVSNMAVYVGRSDSDLNTRLKEHLPWNETNPCIKRSGVLNFYFEGTSSAKDAYALECEWYHKFTPTCNIAHPAKLFFNFTCPKCGL